MTRQAIITSFCFACAVHVTACSTDDFEDLDPASTMGDEQLSDADPADPSEAADAPSDAPEVYALSPFQLPFPCGQVWAGQTRVDHNPQLSVDFNRTNDFGDTVVAAKGGTVTRVANEGNVSYGRWVEIGHGDGYTTRYAHLSVQSVHVGQVVSRGQKIGEVGSTGGSTGPHLHFEERHNGLTIHATFDGRGALYFGTRNYTSQNSCGGGGGVVGRVNTAGAPLTERSAATSNSADVGSVNDGATVHIQCQKHGESIHGTYGTSSLWDKLGDGHFVSDAYVSTGSDGQVAPTCP